MSTRLSRLVLCQGSDEAPPPLVPLRAGPLTLVLEGPDLRYIRLGGVEIVRRLYVSVRDRNWGTIVPRLSNVLVEEQADSFRVSFDAESREGEIDFAWRGEVTGAPDGTIAYTLDGEARSDFLRNRLGFCILHPIRECAGARCRVVHADGSVEEGNFPRLIAPRAPFQEIRAISHEVIPGVRADLEMEGEIFEMEDQRNWIDASFKTFCTPLRVPFPAAVPRGTRIAQSVTLRLRGKAPPRPATTPADQVSIEVHGGGGRQLPGIGLGAASHGEPLGEREVLRLRALNLSHLRVDLDLSSPSWATALRRAAREGEALAVKLEVAIHLSGAAEAETSSLLELVQHLHPRVARWLVFHHAEPTTSGRWVGLVRRRLAEYGPASRVGAGTDAYFTELNRGRPPAANLDFISFSINPQIHAFDLRSLAETLESLGAVLDSAREIAEGNPISVSPVTLKPRRNVVATGPVAEPPPGELPEQVDPRQMSLFGAAWTLGCLKRLAEGGAAWTTWYETSGWRGVLETEGGSQLPSRFRSLPGSVFPLYHVLHAVGRFAGGSILPSRSSAPLEVECMALEAGARRAILVSSLTSEPRRVTADWPSGEARLKRLGEENAERAMLEPEAYQAEPGETLRASGGKLSLELGPYETVRVES